MNAMPVWDAWESEPMSKERVLSVWRRDSVEEVVLLRPQAIADKIHRIWAETAGGYHELKLDPDDGWSRESHVGKDEHDFQGQDLPPFADLLEGDTVPFSECVEVVEAVGGDRQFQVGEVPRQEDTGESYASFDELLTDLAQGDVAPEDITADRKGPDDVAELSTTGRGRSYRT